MTYTETISRKIVEGSPISREEALRLYQQPLEELCATANELRKHFCSNGFDLCTIINGKSGRCSENCRFCAQSAHCRTGVKEYPLLSAREITEQAKIHDAQGVLRYSIVTSGKRLSDSEISQMCETIRMIREESKISVCISLGLLDEDQYRKLKEAGASRVHNNLETSRRNFPNVCTTHTFEDKVNAIRAAQAAGLSVCSGGIMGLGETPEDRIDLAFSLRELGIRSVPINMLNPIPGTPFEHNKRLTAGDMCRIAAVYRFILPEASIRLAGGRGLLPDKGRSCFLSGANAAISGDMLTTAGITVETDKKLLKELGYEIKKSPAKRDSCAEARLQQQPSSFARSAHPCEAFLSYRTNFPIEQDMTTDKRLFITGTGTDVGKTYVASLILKKLNQSGLSAAYFKAAMSGNERDKDGRLIPGDAFHVKEISGIRQPAEEMCPYVYEHAVSPHLASRMEGHPVRLSSVLDSLESVCKKYEYVTMEGSGGLLCPLCFDEEKLWLPDIIKACHMGCLLVADAGLGVINEVGLAAFYMKENDIPLKGIIFNHFRPGDSMQEDNLKMCEYLTGVKVVACVKDGDTELDISGGMLQSLYTADGNQSSNTLRKQEDKA